MLHPGVVRGAMHCGKKWRTALWLNAINAVKSDDFENVAARSLHSFRSNYFASSLHFIYLTCNRDRGGGRTGRVTALPLFCLG